MHEVGIMQSILATVEHQAKVSGARAVHEVRLRVGRLSGVVPEALHWAFEVMRLGTPAAEARLAIEEIAAVCWCARCASEFEVPDFLCACPTCGQISPVLRRGREVEVASMEIS